MPKEPRPNNPQPYKYGDKLLDDTHGLNVYDFEARYSDPALANRFWMVDPLAEKYYNWFPYAYCTNNPIKFGDPTGMWYAIAGGYRTENPQDIERFMNARRTSSLTSQTKESALSSIGFDISEPSKEGANSGRRQQIQQNANNTIETLDNINENLIILIPGGIIWYREYMDEEITNIDIGWEIAGVLPIGRVLGKMGKVTTKIIFSTKIDKTMLRFARETFHGNLALRREASNLVTQVALGNINPGKGINSIKGGAKGVFELREKKGSRIYFRYIDEGIEVLGYSHKGNQEHVIKHLNNTYK